MNETIFQNSEVKLRTPLNEIATEAWSKMMKYIKKLEKNTKNNENINAVFHTMNLHMGLQLFSDPEMAISSVGADGPVLTRRRLLFYYFMESHIRPSNYTFLFQLHNCGTY